ncbi:chromate transporter [Rhizobium sp. SSA_523]|uniref:chromate transporter n=1 Tax=Rhizobium sp. SSA_523 TaxID=2952477 RepID=UPI002090F023|nr:chromate transporter [Rhizobium sp. SSA_523]MCO5732684.1 chromate transporter [Rhizobium sp. SSA_523]WKC23688.1 chromate transporter [Rhizobium sp. SSA_523]
MTPTALPDLEIVPIRPKAREIFAGFLGIGLIGFGGVLPLARRMLVEDKAWLSEQEFSDLLGLCQFLPGGNVINLSIAVGMKFRGWRGALAGILGLTAIPTAFVILLGVLYDRYSGDPHVQHVFAGLAAAAAGLLIAMAWKMLKPLLTRPIALLVVILLFIAVAIVRVPLILAMLVIAPLSILLASRVSR